MRIFKRKQKKMKPDTDYKSERKHKISAGFPQKVLKQLEDLHTLLTTEMDAYGYVRTDYSELTGLTGINNNYMGVLVKENLVLKTTDPEKPKNYLYKWNTIDPTLDMAVMLIEKGYRKKPEKEEEDVTNVVTEDKPESEMIAPESDDFIPLIGFKREGDLLIVRINTKQFNVDEKEILPALMQLLVKK